MQHKQQLLQHPITGEMVDLSGIWDLFERLETKANIKFKQTIKNVKENTAITSRRVFDEYRGDDIKDFKTDLNHFLVFGDFLQSIKIFEQIETEE